jgi:2-polyprenyl-3-methyl-5-hydroxy-6-metoxy-1,4-benzoquinol methylase
LLEWLTKQELESVKSTKILDDIRAVGASYSDKKWYSHFKAWEYSKGYLWLGASGAKKVMDFGCGVSPFPQFLANRGFEVWGVDNNSNNYYSASDLGTDKLQELYPDVHYHFGEIFDLDEKFDAIVSFSVLEHLGEEERKLRIYKRMKELLNDGGKVCHIVDCYSPEVWPRKLRGEVIHFPPIVTSFDISYDPTLCPNPQEVPPAVSPYFLGFGTRVMVAHDV